MSLVTDIATSPTEPEKSRPLLLPICRDLTPPTPYPLIDCHWSGQRSPPAACGENIQALILEESKMARGGYRAGAGRPRKEAGEDDSKLRDGDPPKITPLEYLLSVMNNST